MDSRGIRTALGANGHLGVENVFTGVELAAMEIESGGSEWHIPHNSRIELILNKNQGCRGSNGGE